MVIPWLYRFSSMMGNAVKKASKVHVQHTVHLAVNSSSEKIEDSHTCDQQATGLLDFVETESTTMNGEIMNGTEPRHLCIGNSVPVSNMCSGSSLVSCCSCDQDDHNIKACSNHTTQRNMVSTAAKYDKTDAFDNATRQCKTLLMQMDKGFVPDQIQLKKTLSDVVEVLCSMSNRSESKCSLGYSQLNSLVEDDEVRAWLTSTFTHSESPQSIDIVRSSKNPKPSFRAVVDTIMVGQYFRKIHETPSLYPDGVLEYFKIHRERWNCDIFSLESLTSGKPLKYLSLEIFRFYGFMEEYKISHSSLNSFLESVEEGYRHHNNPYHNSTHATDVMQTVHYFIQSTGLQEWLSSLEILALLFSAMIHDLEHTGTTNNFHIQTQSELALCYNDISVQENYHISKAFSMLTKNNHNIFNHLTHEDYVKLRSLVVEMVLATDMSKHFINLKQMKMLINSQNAWKQIKSEEKPKVLALFLHIADISHPGKTWELHEKWTVRLTEEFFKQGDREKELNIPVSPLCDRNTTAIAESQVGFIDFIVAPTFEVCGNVMKMIIKELSTNNNDHRRKIDGNDIQIWTDHIQDNRLKWKQQWK